MNEQKSYNDKLRELGVTDESVEVHQCQDGIGLCVTRYRNQSGEDGGLIRYCIRKLND